MQVWGWDGEVQKEMQFPKAPGDMPGLGGQDLSEEHAGVCQHTCVPPPPPLSWCNMCVGFVWGKGSTALLFSLTDCCFQKKTF